MFAFIAIWLSVAWAGVASPTVSVEVRVKAKISDDLRTITGTIEAPDHPDLKWVDLLSELPIPSSDRVQQRTFTHNP